MRALALICCCLLTLVCAGISETSESDPDSANIVKLILQMRSGNTRILPSWSQKALHRLGDGVSGALLKILEEGDLNNPRMAETVLGIIRDSFAEPRLISAEVDRKPKATLLLLDYLRKNIADSKVQEEIRQTTEYVKDKAQE